MQREKSYMNDWNPTDLEYHAGMLTNSGRSLFRECPATFWLKYLSGEPADPTWDVDTVEKGYQRIGKYVHARLLDPDAAALKFRESKKAGDRVKYPGMTTLTPAETLTSNFCLTAIQMGGQPGWQHTWAAFAYDLLRPRGNGWTEKAIRATDPETGIELRAKPDCLIRTTDPATGQPVIIMSDIKCVPRVDPSWLYRNRIIPFEMHAQPVHYAATVRLALGLSEDFPVWWRWIFVSTKPLRGRRHGVVVMRPDEDRLAAAKIQLREDLRGIAERLAGDKEWAPRFEPYEIQGDDFPVPEWGGR